MIHQKTLLGRETFSTTRIAFLNKKKEEESHVHHVCKIAANKKKMRVLKPTAGSNQRSVYVLKCYRNKINLFV